MSDVERTSVSRVGLDLPEGAAGPIEVCILSVGQEGALETLGTWVFEGLDTRLELEIDWLDEGPEALKVLLPGGGTPSLTSALRQTETVVRPEMLVRASWSGGALDAPVKVTDTAALERYYASESHQQEYVVQHPFFNAFHEARLRVLSDVFSRAIKPRSRVLDVGSGYGIFYMTRPWDFEMTCCDLDAAAMEKMRGLCPEWEWLVADAVHLPFADGSFDAVYAGEIIEHVPEPRAALREWRRVLNPRGTLIVTTPNRERLLAVANRAVMPVHPEHVREMSLGEARANIIAEGFEVRAVTGIYLELLLNWHRPPGSRGDLLTARFTDPSHERLYRPFMWAGRLMPSRAFDLVFTCRKQ